MYEKMLTKAGLDEKQAKVYLACLELGKAKAPEIARKAELKRTTTYGILDELTGLGLVSFQQSGKIKWFKPADPLALSDMLADNQKIIQGALPELRNMFANRQIFPTVQLFEGREGIKRIYEDTLKCQSKKIQQIVKVKDFIDFPGGDFSRQYIRRRAEKGIVAYALHPASGDIHDKQYGEESQQWKRYVRYLPPDFFYASMIMLYDHKVAMMSTKSENFGFIIESKEFSAALKIQFEFMWKLGTKQPQE
jgi:hypothetical protein